jgi:hypothetical protein
LAWQFWHWFDSSSGLVQPFGEGPKAIQIKIARRRAIVRNCTKGWGLSQAGEPEMILASCFISH